jgi:hypothetical protein
MRGVGDLSREAGAVWLDARRRYRLALDADQRPIGVEVDGAPHALIPMVDHLQPGSQGPGLPPGLILAEPGLPLSTIIRLCQANSHPVLMVDQGRLCGVCGETEIVQALSGIERGG